MADLSKKVLQQNRQENNLLQKHLAAIEKSRRLTLRQMDANMREIQQWAYRLNMQVLKCAEFQGLYANYHQETNEKMPVSVTYCTCSRCLEKWQKTKQWTIRLDGGVDQQKARAAAPSIRRNMKSAFSLSDTVSPKPDQERSRASSIGLPALIGPLAQPLLEQNTCRCSVCTYSLCKMSPVRPLSSFEGTPKLYSEQRATNLEQYNNGLSSRRFFQDQDNKSDTKKTNNLLDEGLVMSYQAMITVTNKGSRYVSNTSFRTVQMARKIQAAKKLIRPQTMPPIKLTQSQLRATGLSH